MDDVLHNTPNVTVTFREVEGTELRRRLVMVGVRLELEIAGYMSVKYVSIERIHYVRWHGSASVPE